MNDRPLRFGPDPNRTPLQRHNAMYPERYGQIDLPLSNPPPRRERGHVASSGNAAGSMVGFVMLVGALAGGCAVLVLLNSLVGAKHIPTWIYLASCSVGGIAGGVLAYLLRYILLVGGFIGIVGYAAWRMHSG